MKKSKLFAVVAAVAMTASLAVTIPARAAGIEMTYLTPAYLKGTVASTERIVADWNKAPVVQPTDNGRSKMAIAIVAAIKPLYPKIGFRLKTGKISVAIPKNGSAKI